MTDIDFSKIFSFSKLKLFDKCKKQYYFNYLDPEITPIKKKLREPRDYKTKGQAVHGAITLFYHLPQNERTLTNLKKCLYQAWFSEKTPEKKPPLGKTGGFNDLNHERKAYRESLKLLSNFSEMEKSQPSLFFVPTKEIKDSFCDYEEMIEFINDKFSVSGKFDRIDELKDGTLRVVDFKTSKNYQDIFQLEFYKLLAELNFKKKVKKVAFYYLVNKKIKEFDAVEIKKKDIKKEVLDRIEKIKGTKKFSPRPSRLCNYCDFKGVCPVFVSLRERNNLIDSLRKD